MTRKNMLSHIESFTGYVTDEQIRLMDCFVARDLAVFMPVAGPCQMAISPMHTHPSHMVIVTFGTGTSIVTQDFTLQSKANMTYFLPAMVPHHEVNEVEIPRYVAIFINPEYWKRQVQAYDVDCETTSRWSVFDCTEELLSAIKRFMAECKFRKPGYQVLLEALSLEVAHNIVRALLGVVNGQCTNVSRMEINRCVEFMRQNISDKLTLSILASHVGMSVSHFARVFRAETGSSPIDFLIDMRLDVAARKLLANAQTMKQIAIECGFSSQAHFSSSFSKKYKISPSEYGNIVRE